jgi:periplasmic protein TonB
VRAALAASGVAHVLLGVALSAVVWSAAPDEPALQTVSMVFEAPADQQSTVATQPMPAAPEPVEPEPPQAEPPVASLPDPVEAAPEPTPAPPSPSPPVAEAAPVVPAPEPTPEPPPPPPPVVVEAPPNPPPPVPQAKPPPSQVPVRPRMAKPMLPHPRPSATSPTEPVSSAPGPLADASPQQATPPEAPPAPGWNSLFSAWLAARKTYPEAARRHGEQGSVTLRFKVAVDGRVLDVALVTGSGSPVLDEAAEALLQNAMLPAPHTEISRTVRLRYRLDD